MREINLALFLSVIVILLPQWLLSRRMVHPAFEDFPDLPAPEVAVCGCLWAAWEAWSDCDSTCFGRRVRSRKMLHRFGGIYTDCDCASNDMEFSYSGCNEVCHNGGSSTGSNCSCVAGYYGSCCSYLINTCSSNPCANGGTCTNGIEMFTCSCLPGWSGVTCAEDIQPPVISGCVSNITVNATTPLRFVNWTAPSFSDPMGNDIQVSSNYPTPEYEFPWGDFVIQYTAVKPSNAMTAECTVHVEVRPTPCEDLPVPENGAVVCNDWRTDYGRYCQVVCHPGYSLPVSVNPDQWYVCGASGNWAPVTQGPLTCRSYSFSNSNTPSINNCSDTEFQSSAKTNFISNIKASAFSEVCNDYLDLCNSDNTNVMC